MAGAIGSVFPVELGGDAAPPVRRRSRAAVADLVVDRGAAAAWARSGVDLLVTLPRYRLENIMSDQLSHGRPGHRRRPALAVAIVIPTVDGGELSQSSGT